MGESKERGAKKAKEKGRKAGARNKEKKAEERNGKRRLGREKEPERRAGTEVESKRGGREMTPAVRPTRGKGNEGNMKKFVTGGGGEEAWRNGMEKILKEISNLRNNMKEELESMREQLEEDRRTRDEERRGEREE